MTRKRICLLYGGKSGEHEVSLRSAASVATHLDPDRYQLIPVGIDRQGRWYLQSEVHQTTLENQVEILLIEERDQPVAVEPGGGLTVKGQKLEVDVAFPVLHGSYGEDGTIQGLLEIAGLPYVGAGVLASSLSLDKEKSNTIWMQAGLPVGAYLIVWDASGQSIRTIEEGLEYPLFVKPARTGSSVGITRVETREALLPALETAFRFDSKVIVEAAIDAREIECSVMGNADPVAFPPGEIVPRHTFYSYEAKYLDPEGAELLLPAPISSTLQERIMELAVKAYRCLDCTGMARVDFFLERGTNRILLNEINTIPGFTSISMFPKMCEQGGLPYPALLERLIALAEEHHAGRQALIHSYRV